MASRLTGDFDAVVQVSGATVNRLLAGLHRNAFTDSGRPSFPHAMSMRIGDPTAVRGHRGWVQAQIGVPLIELRHGSTDRFLLEVGVRARYRADPGSRALPEFINGTVRAEFQVVDIDPNCLGWRNRADEYVWVRVVRGSVQFDGTAADDRSIASVIIDVEDPADVNGRIARLVETLLMTRFEANPHWVGRDFRRSWMRSLNAGGESGVTIPVGFDGPPSGRLSSLGQLFLGGRDVAAAVSTDAIVARINATLQDQLGFITKLRVFHQTTALGFAVLTVDITWNVYLTSAWVEWPTGLIVSLAGGPSSVMTLHLVGKADTSDDDYDIDFSSTQSLAISFDAGAQELVVQPVGSPAVSVDAHMGFPAEGIVESQAPGYIRSMLANRIPTQRISIAAFAAGLNDQLVKLDGGAGASFDTAEFGFDEIVLRGSVWVSPPANPTVAFVKTPEADGFSALEAWIPGGRVDRFAWTWAFPDGGVGKANRDDRWLLRRNAAPSQGRFGMSIGGRSPLPGLDGSGQLCLVVSGVRVDQVTGGLVPVTSTTTCKKYGIWYSTTVTEGIGRPDLRDVPELATDVPFPQLAIRDALLPVGAAGSNTLVVLAGQEIGADASRALIEGLAGVKRRDAGLAVLLLFADGSLSTDGARGVLAELNPRLRRLGAAVQVNEDVGGTWASALGVNRQDEPAWRLLSPRGGVTWAHDGALEPDTLSWALGECLLPSAPPTLAETNPWLTEISVNDIYDAAFADLIDVRSKCPPMSLRGSLESGLEVLFVRAGSAASVDALGAFTARQEETAAAGRSPWTMVVVDGVDQEQADALGRQLGIDMPLLADPAGRISGRLGIRVWPTMLPVGGRRSELRFTSDAPPRHDIQPAAAT